MELDLKKLPFSRFGSYTAFSIYDSGDGTRLCLREVGGGDEDPGILADLRILPTNGNEEEMVVCADESLLTFGPAEGAGMVRICLPTEDTIRIQSPGTGFEMIFTAGKYDHLNRINDCEWEFHSYASDVKLGLIVLAGEVEESSTRDTICSSEAMLRFSGETADIRIRRFVRVPKSPWDNSTFEEDLAAVRSDYEEYLAEIPLCLEDRYAGSRALASYITWSSVVAPSGLLHRPAMYMSNNWMTNIWSWDNCFNAIALAPCRKTLAFDQFIIFRDYQEPSGVLPDFANDRFLSFACCKPPIQGWAWTLMTEADPWFSEEHQLKPAYEMMESLENYWRMYRTRPGDVLPYYNHGNDSGWDNAAVFAEGCPIVSPDLPSYMVLLYETLAETAERRGLSEAAGIWANRGEAMLSALLNELWDGKRFRSRLMRTGRFIETGDSLINRMPIVVGHRLPAEIRTRLVNDLRSGPLRTVHGLATESPSSPFYRSDGYWRGPIWAPVTLLITDGLRRCGEEAEARRLAKDFCDITLSGGMAENFDALSGRGLADPAFTWTSSVFLHFMNNYI